MSVGFSKTSDRQYAIWDPANLSAPLANENIDTASGQLMPFYDNDTGVLFLSGKASKPIFPFQIYLTKIEIRVTVTSDTTSSLMTVLSSTT
mgnify:CR=1 FL=1